MQNRFMTKEVTKNNAKGMIWDGFQWVSKTKWEEEDQGRDRRMARLQISGLPSLATVDKLKEFLFVVMKERFGVEKNPVVQSVLSKDQSSAFLQMASMQDTENAMELSGIEFMGKRLTIARPAGSTGAKPGEFGSTGIVDVLKSKVVQITGALQVDSKLEPEDYDEVEMDMQEAGAEYGSVKKCIILRPRHKKWLACTGLSVGDVLVEFSNAGESALFIQHVSPRPYNSTKLVMIPFDDDLYTSDENVYMIRKNKRE